MCMFDTTLRKRTHQHKGAVIPPVYLLFLHIVFLAHLVYLQFLKDKDQVNRLLVNQHQRTKITLVKYNSIK